MTTMSSISCGSIIKRQKNGVASMRTCFSLTKLDILILSIINHIEYLGIQEFAANALWALSMENELTNTIIELATIKAAIEALQKHIENSNIL